MGHHPYNCERFIQTGLECRYCSYGRTRPKRSKVRPQTLADAIGGRVYEAVVRICEGTEFAGLFHGRGRDLALQLSHQAKVTYLKKVHERMES